MRVYILWATPDLYNNLGGTIIGAYSSIEKADEERRKIQKYHPVYKTWRTHITDTVVDGVKDIM